MNRLSFILFLFFLSSCSVLTKSQLEMVNKMSAASDSVSVAPAYVFQNLAEVRKERGLFFASSLSGPQAHIKEIEGIAKGVEDDAIIVRRADLYVNVLNSYLRALRSISGTARWEDTGRELRGIGRGIDSLLLAYNKLEWSRELETGHAVALGKSVGFLSEEYLKRRQAAVVKEFVSRGDSLVADCCDALVLLLRKEKVEELIVNEEKGLQANYEAYLKALKLRGESPSVTDDRQYLVLRKELSDTRALRDKCATSLRSLKKAHHKVLTELQERKKIDQLYEEIIELNDQASALRKYFVSK